MAYKCFDENTSDTNEGTQINYKKKQLSKELQKAIIKKFEKRKVHSCFLDNIWGAALPEI